MKKNKNSGSLTDLQFIFVTISLNRFGAVLFLFIEQFLFVHAEVLLTVLLTVQGLPGARHASLRPILLEVTAFTICFIKAMILNEWCAMLRI